MAKIKVNFSMKNEDVVQSFETKGIMQDNQITFYDDFKEKHHLTMLNNQLKYVREGEKSLSFLFESNKEHHGTYEIASQKMAFTTQTHQLVMHDGLIKLTYTLKQGSVIVGHAELKLSYARI